MSELPDEAPLLDPDDPDLREVGKLAARELVRRFKKDPSSLPGTFVIKLVLDAKKAEAAGAFKDEEVQEYTSVLEIVRESTLPKERKRELLLTERERLQSEWFLVKEELEKMEDADG